MLVVEEGNILVEAVFILGIDSSRHLQSWAFESHDGPPRLVGSAEDESTAAVGSS